MKKIDNTEKWNDREWAGAAAWLSGEENGSGEGEYCPCKATVRS